jgi:hypothetical protein
MVVADMGDCLAFELRMLFLEVHASWLSRSFEAFNVPLGDHRPDHLTSQFPRSLARCCHQDWIGEKTVHPIRYRFRISERHQDAAVVCQQLLCMPVRGRMTAFPAPKL